MSYVQAGGTAIACPSFIGVTSGSGAAPVGSFLLLVDGVSFVLLVDGVSKIILAGP